MVGFGNLGVRIKNVITYQVSPYELKPFKGFFSKSPGNWIRRIKSQIPFMAPGFITLGLVVYFAKKEHHRLSRKDPNDYIDEV